ncbi:MAG: flippase-like domain-containing protein [Candidatus Hadarchaeota archaeon]
MILMANKEVKVGLRRLIVSLLAVVILAIMALFFVSQEDLGGMINAILGANYFFVGAAIGIYFLGLALWSVRWIMILKSAGYETKFSSIYPIVWGGVFINNITPFTYSGGDPIARSYLLKKTQGIPYSSGFATMIGEFVMDFPIFFSFLLLGAILVFGGGALSSTFALIGVWVVVLVLFITLAPRLFCKLSSPRVVKLAGWILKKLRRPKSETRISKEFSHFTGCLLMIVKKRFALPIAAASVLIWTVIIMRYLLIFLALGFTPPFSMLFLTLTLSAIVGLVPILPAGLGTVDLTYISIFTFFGVPAPIALSAVLIERSITFVMATLIGAGVISYFGIKVWSK